MAMLLLLCARVRGGEWSQFNDDDDDDHHSWRAAQTGDSL